jgi:putative selenium metabolism protein SsnA
MILTNARILTFDSTNRVLDSGSVEIQDDGSIGFVRGGRARGTHTIDLQGRLLMPALINAHTHLYSTLARGIHLPGAPPFGFTNILKKLWWRLDRALTEEDVYYSALVGLIDSAKCGVGTVIDHHASPNACAGSLDVIERAFHEVGVRGATCYETSDRNGRRGADAAIRENVRFIERVKPGAQVGAMFGLHAAFTLGDRTLHACAEAKPKGSGFHIHAAEDVCDRGAVRRLCEFGVLDERAIAAHCIHIAASERRALARRRVNVVHNPQSNCNNAVGTIDLPAHVRAGVRVGLGTDGYTPRIWDEFKTACNVQKLRARDSRVAGTEVYAAAFVNNRAIVKDLWGIELGRVESGAKADLLLLDYNPPTPIDATNLFGHLLFGAANAPVDSLMVNGRWVVRAGHCVNVDEREIAEKAAVCAKALWDRF